MSRYDFFVKKNIIFDEQSFSIFFAGNNCDKNELRRKNPLPVKTMAISRDVSGGIQTLRNRGP